MAKVIDIHKQRVISSITMLDAQARWVLGAATCGVSVVGDDVTIHLLADNATLEDVDRAGEILDRLETLEVVSDKGTIQADDVDAATITCDDPAIAGDAGVEHIVYGADGQVDFGGLTPVVGGVATYLFQTALAGRYWIEFRRTTGLETGCVEVIAHD